MKSKDKLRVYWSKKENDVMLYHPFGIGTKSDAHYLSWVFNKEFQNRLKECGYDITTMKFEICPQKGNNRFASERIQPANTADSKSRAAD